MNVSIKYGKSVIFLSSLSNMTNIPPFPYDP